ncbi:MAG: sigma-54-dependent Fis family transcriptional regulator [Acidobacteria bacterium]|nr:sigma-54-dependent Fis family transcriptional regulator [Acidobacteriota bacterium]MBI3657999.1 sigma-54-dependent Fis family transcriptional regulator [Acidobacteriota bacterium]
MKPKARILIVDDERGVRSSLVGVLKDEGYSADAVNDGEACLEAIGRQPYDVVLLDVWLPGMDGLATLAEIRKRSMPANVVMISGHGTIETAVKATKLGAFDFLEKPLSYEKTLVVIKNALTQKNLEEENLALREEIDQKYVMIGESIPMKALRQQIAFAAPTNARVLIYGENGTGKELVAHLLHWHSLRKDRRLVEVNCAAIPEDLIESELFGHIKGAFTGATLDKAGKFEMADGGTLFLDEVGDMSLKTQAKVLRALEEQRFEPLGSNRELRVDVRVIAATNKNLEVEIDKGYFRDDLYYRLNVIPFEVPPLRDRKEDIPLLAAYFLDDFSNKYAIKRKRLADSALGRLTDYSWPGNVRELKNLIERLIIMTAASRIDGYDLPDYIVGAEVPDGRAAADARSLQGAREVFERNFILHKLHECRGNISKVAEILHIERSSLYKKMKAYGIPYSRKDFETETSAE